VTHCHGCGDPLTGDNDSEAHIIPNALGGWLAPKGIICRTCNTKLDKIADNALIEAFGHWPTLLNIPRQRGDNPPRTIDTLEGNRVRLEQDGSLMRMNIQYDVQPVEGGHFVEVGAGNMKTVRQLIERAAKQFPQLDAKAAEAHARTIGVSPDDELHLRLDYSPPAAFGGVATAIWLYLILKTGRAFLDWDGLLKYIDNAQKHGGSFRYFTGGLPGLTGPRIDLGHKLVVRSVPSTGNLIAYVEILGVLKIGAVFASSPPPAIAVEHIYAYDLQTRKDRSAEFSTDAAVFDSQNWPSVGLRPTSADAPALKAYFKSALEVLEGLYRQRFADVSDVAQ
jgi:hypothetical protein